MNTQSILGDISSIVKTVGEITKGNPEKKDFRLKRKMKRQLRKHLKDADEKLDDLKEVLSNDSDGFTEKDKAMIKEAEDAIAEQHLLLIKMGIY